MSNYNYFNTIQNVGIDEAVIESALFAGELNNTLPSVAIGPFAGQTNQGDNAIAIGADSGEFNQGAAGIAIGVYAGYTGQNEMAIAIGGGAGQTNQGTNSIAIGENASATGANAIVLNASGTLLSGFTGGFFATPIRAQGGSAARALWYTTNGEICYGTLA
jgi:hypothetical protein